jgi:hypothetical protein
MRVVFVPFSAPAGNPAPTRHSALLGLRTMPLVGIGFSRVLMAAPRSAAVQDDAVEKAAQPQSEEDTG